MARDENGQFAKGNPGGPGRPRRALERDYLRAMSDVVSADDWGKICERARDDALAGDAKARLWLSKYLVGDGSMSLSETLSADERKAARLETADDMQAVLIEMGY